MAREKLGDPARARAALLETIEKQILSNDPPETGQTLERLLRQGFSREASLRYIASALVGELFGVLRNEASFDQARYIANLNALPKLPWDA
jgi:hypothetical protein